LRWPLFWNKNGVEFFLPLSGSIGFSLPLDFPSCKWVKENGSRLQKLVRENVSELQNFLKCQQFSMILLRWRPLYWIFILLKLYPDRLLKPYTIDPKPQCCGSGIRCLFDPGIRDGYKIKIRIRRWTFRIIFPRA
jgi:hypothetical protein